MKSFIYLAFGILFGAGIGYLYAISLYEDRNEDIVKKEITLLNQYSNIPTCSDLKGHYDILVQKNEGENKLFWFYISKEKLLKKVVISSDLIVAYETIENICD